MQTKEELLIIIEFIENIFPANNQNNLITLSSEFLVQKFNLSNCSIKINNSKTRFYKNQQTEHTYEQIEAIIEKILNELKTPIIIKSLKEDILTKNIKDIEKTSQVLLSIPILKEKQATGAIHLYSELNIEPIFKIITKIAEKLEKAHITIEKLEKAEQSSITDPLTQLYNRTYMQQSLEKTILRSKKEKKPTSLIICDIDDFKKFNDTKGHLEGDKILKKVSEVIKENFRFQDICARYGGEEFIIILPETDTKTALERAEKLLKEIKEKSQLTLSIGLITCLNSSMNHEELLTKADEALYKAKNTGKNKIVNYVAVDKSLGIIDTNEANSIGKYKQ